MNPDDIDTRLADLERSIPVTAGPPALPGRSGRRGRHALPLVVGPIIVLAFAATAVGGAVVGGMVAGMAPGVENPGQPLAGARLECMSPPDAARYLAAHGYTNVVWQIEAGGDGKAGSSWQQSTPPDHGYVIPASILGDGKLYMVVDQHPSATGVGACYGMPMP